MTTQALTMLSNLTLTHVLIEQNIIATFRTRTWSTEIRTTGC